MAAHTGHQPRGQGDALMYGGLAPGLQRPRWSAADGSGFLTVVLVALWPVWSWSVDRFLDGSDDPWGVLAIVMLGVLLFRDRAAFTRAPRTGWLVAASAATCAAVVTTGWLPALMRGVFASLAVTAALMAVRRGRSPMLAYLTLALLSLPILSSLQFYLGYPLRVITAEASAGLLSAAGFDAQRTGSALMVDGALVIVDAPCAGIHMAWAAYFTASVAGAWLRHASLDYLLRTSCVGLIVIVMNVLRNTALVLLETRPAGLSDAWHESTGVAAFSVVCMSTLWLMKRESPLLAATRAVGPGLTGAAR
jgi:exosortase/archaeosortase family protein